MSAAQRQAPQSAPVAEVPYEALGRLFENLAREGRLAPAGRPELTIVVPTLNEGENIAALVQGIEAALAGVHWEVVFVDDDSADATRAVAAAMAREDARVRLVHRIGRRGLSTAVIEGALSSTSPFIAVMDADLQHDEALLPDMLAQLKTGALDLVVGSRFCGDGSAAGLHGARVGMSQLGADAARLALKVDLTDPMSGFFMVRREAFDAAVRRLSGQGYKILVDLCASSPTPLRTRELPYTFRDRAAGASKLDSVVVWDYGMLLADKLTGGRIPVRFISFALVGAAGLVVHLSVLAGLLAAGVAFAWGQAGAAVVAMTFNFFLNNHLTYRDKRLKGWRRVCLGLLSFYAVCSVGAVGSVGVATLLFAQHWTWQLSAAAGVMVGAAWNYAASTISTWGAK